MVLCKQSDFAAQGYRAAMLSKGHFDLGTKKPFIHAGLRGVALKRKEGIEPRGGNCFLLARGQRKSDS